MAMGAFSLLSFCLCWLHCVHEKLSFKPRKFSFFCLELVLPDKEIQSVVSG